MDSLGKDELDTGPFPEIVRVADWNAFRQVRLQYMFRVRDMSAEKGFSRIVKQFVDCRQAL